MHRRTFLPLLGSAVATSLPLSGVPLSAAFAAWPDQPIRMVVPYTPATGPDMIGRWAAGLLRGRWRGGDISRAPAQRGELASLQKLLFEKIFVFL